MLLSAGSQRVGRDMTEQLKNKHTNTVSGCQIQKSLLKSQLQDRAFQTLSSNGPFGFLISNLSLTDAL